jgi:hypothetical protein
MRSARHRSLWCWLPVLRSVRLYVRRRAFLLNVQSKAVHVHNIDCTCFIEAALFSAWVSEIGLTV